MQRLLSWLNNYIDFTDLINNESCKYNAITMGEPYIFDNYNGHKNLNSETMKLWNKHITSRRMST